MKKRSKLEIQRFINGYSLREVASILQMSHETVRRWELGTWKFKAHEEKLAKLYNCEVKDLYDDLLL